VKTLVRASRNAALAASLTLMLVGLVAGAVRVLPWLLDPAVPWRVAAPFARGLVAIALEAALLVGWPVGWALACFRLVESGEIRVLQTLGEAPPVTVARLVPQGAVLALALASVALVYGSDANAPGRVATELVASARTSCEAAHEPVTYAVPFTDMTWLCAPHREPRLVGAPPGMSSLVLTARGGRIAGDFRAVELEDARVLIPGTTPIAAHAGTLSMHGMAPWAHASTLPAPLRALVLALAGWLAASVAAYVVLLKAARTRVGVLVVGAAGPLVALGLMRILEEAGSRPWAFALVPVAAGACAPALAAVLSRLRRTGRAASTWIKV
jgi:hypothetical protein